MIATATTTVSVYGAASTTDDFGDVVASNVKTAGRIPMSIVEQRILATTANDDRAQVIRFYTGRAPSTAPITSGSRLLDERTGDVYLVDAVSHVASFATTNDLRCDLRRA